MAVGLLTPLQLIVTSALLNNQGIKGLPSVLTSAITAFNNTTIVSAFNAAMAYYVVQNWADEATLTNLQTIGSSNCAALGNSIPAAFTTLTPVISPGGFSGLITQTGNTYLGNGDVGKFVQGFMAVQSYITTTNLFINSAVNAQTYLGPTFRNINSLVTNNLSEVNSNFAGFATDLSKQGQLTNFGQLSLYGTPAGLLKQLSNMARLTTSTIQVVETQLVAAGLTLEDITVLLSDQNAVSENQFNQLQLLAYQAMKKVTGDDLQQVLDILEVTTDNIVSMADLLNPQKIFPNSYSTLKTPTLAGFVPVYQDNGSVNMNLVDNLGESLSGPTGCKDLGKIIPPDQAVANKSIQLAFEQVTNIAAVEGPVLAQTIMGSSSVPWNNQRSYLANETVQVGSPIPVTYRAQQSVPVGTDISNSQYWLPTSLGGLNTMAGLPDLEALNQPVPQSVINYWLTFATGTGPNGTINLCDVIGLAIDSNNFAARLSEATTAIDSLAPSADRTALITAYTNMLTAGDNATMQTYINDANAAIVNIVNGTLNPGYTNAVTAMNSAFNAMATTLSKELSYQTAAGIEYSQIQSGNKSSIYSFVQSLPGLGTQTDACGPAYFLNQVADLSIMGGQAIVGVMREGSNNQRLDAALIGVNVTAPPDPEVTPVPVVNPVY